MRVQLKRKRTLGIFDSELNQNNKRIGKDDMNNVIKLEKNAQEQFGAKNR